MGERRPCGVPPRAGGLVPLLERLASLGGSYAGVAPDLLTGAILAAALAARRPDLVSGLLLLGLPAYPDKATARDEVGNLGLLARLTADGRPVAALVCNAMCRVRPLATALAPLVARDVPREVAADWTQHTWPSYSRTLTAVVLGLRVVPDLAAAYCPVIALTGRSDTSAPARHLKRPQPHSPPATHRSEVRVVDGDHRLAIRQSAARPRRPGGGTPLTLAEQPPGSQGRPGRTAPPIGGTSGTAPPRSTIHNTPRAGDWLICHPTWGGYTGRRRASPIPKPEGAHPL